ncbi:Ig-like domain-containing protein [Occallatibacter savannae]|uniref:Ig-like domain-containing protein n=1 Tax=Occallatibacter savannae TaxID=1002691 RepID=UPI000D6870E4|nr:Ig-like domain-containing protein [Occallatibacter savannae]
MKYLFAVSSLALIVSAVPAFSSVTVTSPTNGSQVSSPFNLVATASACSGQSIASMGYSIDSSTSTTVFYSSAINATVSSSSGSHTLHVKSWGNQGAACVTDVAISVGSGSTSTSAISPSGATVVSGLQKSNYYWKQASDSGTNGISSGSMSVTSSPSLSGSTRKFVTSYRYSGGERYWTSFGADTNAHNFLYDVYVYLDSTATDIANIEMDMNQVIGNGQTIIYGFQCDGYTSTWDYTTNAGTPDHPVDEWLHSSVPCNPRNWTRNTWHHVQVAYSRDNSGNVTYKNVTFDGVQKSINETVPAAFALGWGPTLLTNFQIDGLGGYGTANAYIDNLTITRW